MLTPKRAGERGDLGEHARAVGHRDAQLDQRLLDRRARRAGCGARRALGSSSVEQRVAVAAGDDARARA